jgi:very-short-patch-repair endonuclease
MLIVKRPMDLKCLHEGCYYQWAAVANNLFHPTNETGCPACSLGKNEKLVGKVLADKQITYQTQKFIRDIFNHSEKVSKIRVDIYLPQINLIIEYNGKQHYQPVTFGGISQKRAIVNFDKQQARDQYLQQFCDQNGITLIWIDGRKYKGEKLKSYLLDNIIPKLLEQIKQIAA